MANLVSSANFQTDKLLFPSLLQNCLARHEMIIAHIRGVPEQSILILVADSILDSMTILNYNLNN